MPWRSKKMHVNDWGPLQERFGELQLVLGAPLEFAMFSHHEPGDPEQTILITDHQSELVERLSPGVWEDCDPSDKEWTLLVGHHNAREALGLRAPWVG